MEVITAKLVDRAMSRAGALSPLPFDGPSDTTEDAVCQSKLRSSLQHTPGIPDGLTTMDNRRSASAVVDSASPQAVLCPSLDATHTLDSPRDVQGPREVLLKAELCALALLAEKRRTLKAEASGGVGLSQLGAECQVMTAGADWEVWGVEGGD